MDLKTILFALALGNLTLCAALFFHQHGKAPAAALATWTRGRQLQAAAWLVLCFHGSGVLPTLATGIAGYALLFGGLGLESGAFWETAGKEHWRSRMVPAIVLAILLYGAAYVVDEPGVRLLAGALATGAFYMSVAAALAAGWKNAVMLRRALALTTAVLAVLVAVRGVLAVAMPLGWGGLSLAVVQYLASASLYLLMLITGFGFLLLERERQVRELERVAVLDTLLDVPNRRGFFAALAPWMALARRPGVPTALVVFDVDNFKRINDDYGHPAGDVVLRTIVDMCRKQLRDSDQIGRLVGVEFALLLPRTELQHALTVAERIRACIEVTPIKTGRALVNMTVSMGVTTIRADDSTVSLFKRVDEALQTAKMAGRNRIAEAAPPIPAATP